MPGLSQWAYANQRLMSNNEIHDPVPFIKR